MKGVVVSSSSGGMVGSIAEQETQRVGTAVAFPVPPEIRPVEKSAVSEPLT